MFAMAVGNVERCVFAGGRGPLQVAWGLTRGSVAEIQPSAGWPAGSVQKDQELAVTRRSELWDK